MRTFIDLLATTQLDVDRASWAIDRARRVVLFASRPELDTDSASYFNSVACCSRSASS
jgi:hypothetical protein